MKTLIRRSVTGLLALSALTLAAPATGSGEAAPDDGGTDTLIVGTYTLGDIPHLNPLDSGWLLQGEINNLMYEPMISWSQDDYTPSPGLAVEWGPKQGDPLTWVYELDPEATWSDGTPITADDAAFTYQMLMENTTLNGRHGVLVDNFKSVEATDDHTLTIKIKKPSALMNHLNGTAIMIMPKAQWSKLDDPSKYQGEPDQPTSGAFHLKEFSAGERIVLEANPDYWRGPVAYDEFVLQNYETPEALVQALRAGEVDLIGGLTPQQFDALDGVDGVTTSAGQGRRWQSIAFNVGSQTQDGQPFGDGHPALRDPAVRQAIHHVIDKQRLIDVVRGGHATPGVSIVSELFSDNFWDPGDDTVEVSADAGNQILDDAGYTERDSNGIRVDPESGRPLKFRLFYHSDRPDYAIIKDFLVDWVAELDIQLDDVAMETTPLDEATYAGNFDIAFGNWSPGPDPAEDLAYHTCDRLPAKVEPTDLTFSFYCDEQFDALYEQQETEIDPDKRSDLIRQMQQKLYEDSPQVILYYEGQLEAYNSDRWSGFETQPTEDGMIREQQGAYGFESAVPAGSDSPETGATNDDGSAAPAGGDDATGDTGADEAGSTDDGDGGGGGAVVWIVIVVVVVLVIGGVLLVMQRRRSAGERE